MSLSEQEQRALREIEKSLLAEDPNFGASVSSDSSFGGSGGAITLRGMALVVVGLVMLVGGVALAQTSLWFVLLSIAGFLVMFGSGIWMLWGSRTGSAGASKKKRKSKSGKANSADSNGAASKLEENFRRRFEER
ncbi:DUF3040 domain-containing protein [Corynebacterium ammoniagenes]|uniref:DUF3040 domain-containing protein n=2 Tax=Corynebacterium ammoniagenes TaxID=1697 RepID=A0AAV5G9D1_CORAM|nr:DUF3040 domain-containing protein [Corynebacterium ammoniagenes]APT82293.1 membrane protein [Corynebacterium ammoniagenes DSM 20306]AQS73384.1 hypothetical protein CA40472_05320 [Corynebacterium ammoniagenes]EFG82499.1 hypothetical protein HMPREF0281_00029 [Corynebacterium ammoniagenes DSM 20306]NMF31101.1 DUF3040 domain-containing protein [Corynebacterium ammoniagenes]GJN42121.1 hypothetical protein CAT723_06000 [Corynebacterium ammoniagenes]